MLQSLLLKVLLLGVTVAVVLWIGWPVPSPAPSDSAPEAGDGASQSTPAASRGTASVTEGAQPERPARDGRAGLAAASSLERPPYVRLDINRATREEFQALPGIGEQLAKRVIERRAARGSFRTVEDLLEVKGIGVKRLDRLRPFLTAGQGSPHAGPPGQSRPSGLPEKRRL
jgi:competence protein ComEA